jgi:phosphoglycolate phosphatase
MPGWAAAWGYLGVAEPVHAWGAQAVIETPAALLKRLALA